jgi:drug/metabolite transporter (DMT)-like permease
MKQFPLSRDLLVLLAAIVLLALTSPLVKWLMMHGGSSGLVAPDAISFCNVLFVGNLCAGLTTLFFFGPRATLAGARRVQHRLLLLVNVLFAVAIPSLLFTALETTSITNLILLGRFEAISFAGFSALFFRSKLTRHQAAGYAVITIGILALVIVQGMGSFTRGDLYVILAATLQGLAACASKICVGGMPLRSFVFVRNAGSAIVFFVIAIKLYGPGHFAEAFGPGLWVVMGVYGLGVVALGQLAWYRSLERVRPATIAALAMCSPAVAILFAIALLGELPTGAQILGGVIIAAGMVVAGRGRSGEQPETGATEASLAGAPPVPLAAAAGILDPVPDSSREFADEG